MMYGVMSKCCRKPYVTSLLRQIHQHVVLHDTTKLVFKMNEAFIRYADGNENFDFTFRYANDELKIDRQFNLSRRKSENVESFLRRIDANVGKILYNKKKRKSKKNPTLEVLEEKVDNVQAGNITLMKKNSKVELEESCENLLADPSQLSMMILGVPYKIKYNAPWIINMKLPKSLLAGFPIYPSEFEALFFNENKSKFTWYKSDLSKQKISWKEVGDGYIYIPTNDDIGSRLKLKCLPRNDRHDGPEMEIESTKAVEVGPGTCPFELRQSFTQTKLSGNNFRITSYNILADTYADSDYSREVLFPYCPPYALAIDYRKLLIIRELIGYNSDIICLQEVDKKIYDNDFMPTLSTLNYEGVYNAKGELKEGLAIMYDKTRFELLDKMGVVLSQNIESNENFKKIWDNITNENVKKRFLDRSTSMMIVTLRSLDNPTEILLVGNTHLYFYPDADHIRLLQAYYALTACQDTAAEIRKKYPEYNVTLMLSGDFNSSPVDGVYELMTKNYVPEGHKDWSSNAQENVDKISLAHDLSLASACGTPEYTNYTVDFADCLDYIYYESNKLNVTQVVPMPSKEELSLHSAIPSVVFPSDHVAICADMQWTCK